MRRNFIERGLIAEILLDIVDRVFDSLIIGGLLAEVTHEISVAVGLVWLDPNVAESRRGC